MPHKITDDLMSIRNNGKLSINGHELEVSNLNKILWPATNKKGITKRDYLLYLMSIAPVLLPHLRNRPITLVRYPNGLGGQKFFQKHWDHALPEFVETVRYFSTSNDEDQDYLLCNNLATLLWLGQVADLELHTVHSRIITSPDARGLSRKFTGSEKAIESSVLNYPDFIVLDLDPYIYSGKEAKGEEPQLNLRAFKRTCRAAHSLKNILDGLGMRAFIKTTGKTGLHIYIPIVRNVDYDDVRMFAETLGRYLMQEHPTTISMEWATKKRTGKIFFDHNMNARGKTLASIYSPRAVENAVVSTPISWDEIDSIYPTNFTIKNIPERIAKFGDLWADILLSKTDLHAVLSAEPKRSNSSRWI